MKLLQQRKNEVYMEIGRHCGVTVLYCIVLMGWSLLHDALRSFKIYCAPPNLGITKSEYAD